MKVGFFWHVMTDEMKMTDDDNNHRSPNYCHAKGW